MIGRSDSCHRLPDTYSLELRKSLYAGQHVLAFTKAALARISPIRFSSGWSGATLRTMYALRSRLMNFRIIQRNQRLMFRSKLLSNEHLLDGTPMTLWRL